MRIDLEDFRQNYAGLSDDALLALDRSELVDDARKCYDQELARRRLEKSPEPRSPAGRCDRIVRLTRVYCEEVARRNR